MPLANFYLLKQKLITSLTAQSYNKMLKICGLLLEIQESLKSWERFAEKNYNLL